MPVEDIGRQEPAATGQESFPEEHSQERANPEPPDSKQIKPEGTAALLSELVALIRRANEPSEPVVTPWAKIRQHFKAVTKAIKDYWVWLPIVGFLLAWLIYRFDPFYVFDQYKIASDESAAKIANIAHKKKALEYYVHLGNKLLSDGKSKDAAQAYEQAKRIDPFSLQAEYGLRKTTLLAFSEEEQFDPVVVEARFSEVEKLAPGSVSDANDPHILYAKALFLWKTGRSPQNTEAVKRLLEKIEPEENKHSAALGLLGAIALDEGNIDLAIESFDKALNISPHHWNYVNNLAYAHQLRADEHFRQGQRNKGQEALKKAYAHYLRATNLDAEVITPHIEMLRLRALLELPSGRLDLKVDNLVAQIESDSLQLMEKNKEEIFYRLFDPQGNERAFGVYSWEAKKAYLRQLQWLVDYFDPGMAAPDKDTIRAELAKIQETAIDGKANLPWFLWNDLHALKDYSPDWVKQSKVAQKYEVLLSVAKLSVVDSE